MLAEGLKHFFKIIISCQKLHFNTWLNILQLPNNHIITYFLLYAAYKNDFLISDFSFFCDPSFTTFSFSEGILYL